MFPTPSRKKKNQKNKLKQHAKATRSSWGYSKSQRLIQPMAGHFRSNQHLSTDAFEKNAPKSSEKSSPGFVKITFVVGNFGIITCLL